MTLRYLSVCSVIEAASVAWHPFGWRPVAFSEIEPFPRAVLAHRWPGVPLHGDFTTIGAADYGPIDLLVGGTPCQSFSVAGLRAGLADERGNLALEFLRLADRKRPRWVFWENVPGVLSQDGGRAFGSILGGMVECGYGFAYRVLDAQYFGLAQKRARVFVVGYLGDWRPAAAVLFERESLRRNPPPRRKKGQIVAALTARGVGTCGADDNQAQAGHLLEVYGGNNCSGPIEVSPALTAHGGPSGRMDFETEAFIAEVAPALRARGDFDNDGDEGALIAFDCKSSDPARGITGAVAGTLRAMDHAGSHQNGGGNLAVMTGGGHGAVRRLTPRECERLQGFPDDYTLIPWRKGLAPDGLRYRALGNSMAVSVMGWIGARIDGVQRGMAA